MSFICEIFEDLHILNKCVNKENQAVQSNTSSQLQKLSLYTRAATSTLVLITQLQGIGGRRKAAVRLDCISAKKSLLNFTIHDVCSFFIHGKKCVYFPLNIELVHCLKLQQPHVVGGGLCTVCSVQRRQRQPFHGPAAAPAFLTKNRPFRWQPVSLFHQPVEHVMLGVGELGSTL